jgi:hypothetical protein
VYYFAGEFWCLFVFNMTEEGRAKRKRVREDDSPFPSRPSKRKTNVLSRHTAELASSYNKGVSPSDIARILREKYGYTDDVVNLRTVSDRVNYIKKNNLAKLSPVNTPDLLTATARRPRDCNFPFKILI